MYFVHFVIKKAAAAAPLAKLYSKCLYAKYFVRQKGLRIIWKQTHKKRKKKTNPIVNILYNNIKVVVFVVV